MFLGGRIATNDGGTVPMDTLVARVCNSRVHQEVYASPKGEFSMQLGSRADSFPEASADVTSSSSMSSREFTHVELPRHELLRPGGICGLRLAGFHSRDVTLLGLDTAGGFRGRGRYCLWREGSKVEGATLNAAPYKAPKDARKAYENGLQAEETANLPMRTNIFKLPWRFIPNS